MDRSASQPAVNHQRNILLIGIDSFQAEEPRLEGVWMVLYLRDLPHFMLVPVYPNRTPGEQNSAVVDQNLAHLFTLEDNQTPGNLFFQALKDKELWWNGYLILDRAALSEIIALTAGEDEATQQEPAVICIRIYLILKKNRCAPCLGRCRLPRNCAGISGWCLPPAATGSPP